MEPPSSINTNRDAVAGPLSDDPLSCKLTEDSYLIVSRPEDDDLAGGLLVCAYSARTGLVYLGTTGTELS